MQMQKQKEREIGREEIKLIKGRIDGWRERGKRKERWGVKK